MNIGFYGQIATPFGGSADIGVPDDGISVSELRQILSERFETDDILQRSVRAAVNDEIVLESHQVLPGDRVEFMSPVSGG